jgi:aspartyl-tRNA(Asn)/glutamyl-tRNA(Gln) amidotransferase subunit B
VVSETRGWDSERGITRSQRSKEEVHDYRYFPDPDLPPLYLSQAEIDRVAAALPLLPLHRRDRYLAHLGLSPEGASQLSSERELADFFDALLVAAGLPEADLAGSLSDSERGLAKSAANWLLSELLGLLHRDGKSLAESLVKPQQLAELLQLLADDTISGKQAKELFARMYQSGDSAAALVDSLGLRQLRDPTAIAAVCQQILAEPAHQKQVAGYAKNPKLLGFFVGKVLAATAGRANPELVSATLVRLLSEKS